VIGRELEFTDADMVLFAAGSGDVSPLHTDQDFARHTSYGACIVYGGLLSIAMLGTLPPAALASIRTVRSSFPGPVLPGTTLRLRAVEHPARAGTWEVKATGDEKLLARLVAESHRDGRADAVLTRANEDNGASIGGVYEPGSELRSLAGRLGAESLHPALLDGIGWASYLVGMGMPDFEGLCAAVDVTTAGDDGSPEPTARGRALVRDHDTRTQRRLLEGVLFDVSGAPRSVDQVECFPLSVLEA